MRLLTCGSRLEIPQGIIQQFDGVFAGYFWNLWSEDPNINVFKNAEKYQKTEIWSSFLYGNKHRFPGTSSGASTIDEWVKKLVADNQRVTHWNLINEFINDRDNYSPYPGYEYENIKKYLITAKEANPNTKLVISDFRPHQLDRWRKIRAICEQLLTENIPLDGVGIQVHFKTRNAHSPIPGVPYILDALPTVIKMFDDICPVHLTEVSGWRHYSENHSKLNTLWNEVLTIATINNVETFCPWWLNEYDEKYPRAMPTFEEFLGAGIYSKEWNQLLSLPLNQRGN